MAFRIINAPKISDLEDKVPAVNQWFIGVTERMNVLKGATNPTVSMVPEHQWIIFHNTALGEVRIWTNIGGVLKSSAAFT